MPIIKSAKKRVKVASRATIRNAKTKRAMREAIKSFNRAVTAGKASDILDTQKTAVSLIDQAAKKDILHKNKAARIKARLSAQAKSAGAKPAKTAKAPVKKAAAKTAPKKKPASKKPVVKKSNSK